MSVGLLVISSSALIFHTTNAASTPSVQKPPMELPNCENPADQFEASFCQIQPNCDQPMAQMEMNYCSAWSAKLSDRQLNLAYQQVKQHYNRNDDQQYRQMRLNHLIDAQLDWIKYRDSNCKWEASKYDGGSIQSMIYSGCLDRMTQQRTQELLDSLKP